MTIRSYSSPEAFKQALEQRLRTSAQTSAPAARMHGGAPTRCVWGAGDRAHRRAACDPRPPAPPPMTVPPRLPPPRDGDEGHSAHIVMSVAASIASW